MRIIFVILLCLVLRCKIPTTAANTEQSCSSSLQDDLLQSCKANEQFCTENNKLLRNHIELLTNSMEELTINSCEKPYDQVQRLLAKQNELGKEIERKKERIRELEENMKKDQTENINYKSMETGKLEDLNQKMEQLQLSNNLCESEKKEFKVRETELQRELQSKIEQIRQLEEKEDSMAAVQEEFRKQIENENYKSKEFQKQLDSKNVEIRQLENNMTKLQMENVNYKSKEDFMAAVQEELRKQIENENYKAKEFQKQLDSKNVEIRQLENNMTKLQIENVNYKSKEDSMAAVQEELQKQQVINEQLRKNLREKENTEIAQIKAQLSSESDRLENCNTELESLRETVDKLETDSSGVYTVTLFNNDSFEALFNFDIAGPDWIVIQQRIKGGVDFNRDWKTYRNGFGDFWDGDFFLGLEKIHRLTADEPYELYIHMTRFDGSTFFASYDEFAISGEEDKYKLTKLGEFKGPTKDKLRYHIYEEFSTYDRDNDSSFFKNCAEKYEAGWWYNGCAECNLNGIYYGGEVRKKNGIFWEDYTSLKQVRMMIRSLENSKNNI